MEQLDYNLLFRWFVGLNIDDPVWDRRPPAIDPGLGLCLQLPRRAH